MSRWDWFLSWFNGWSFQLLVAGFLVVLLIVAWWYDWGVVRCKYCGQPTINQKFNTCDNPECRSKRK